MNKVKETSGRIITLTTDFGLEDEYVGVMKGVILSICRRAVVVDLTHNIAPQNLDSAGYLLRSAYSFFPSGTVHVVVVDPGVGTQRRILAVKVNGHVFLAPDNGVLTPLIHKEHVEEIREVSCSEYFLRPVSSTFHGRDIFSPVAAHLAGGASFNGLGPILPIQDIVCSELKAVRVLENNGIRGFVISVDRFGNLVSNIEAAAMKDLAIQGHGEEMSFLIKGQCFTGLATSYASVEPGQPLAIIGSRGYLEIAVNRGSAADQFNMHVGEEIEVRSGVKS